MNISDEAVVLKIQKGDFEAFREIIRRYEEKLIYYSFRILGDRDAAEDAVQVGFIKCYRNINSFDVNKKFSSWIYRIVHNESINLYHKLNKNISIEDIEYSIAGEDSENSVHKKLDNKKNRELLEQALLLLPVKFREAIILKYFEDKSYEEISDIMRIPVNTVGTYISRGKKELKEQFKGIELEELV